MGYIERLEESLDLALENGEITDQEAREIHRAEMANLEEYYDH